MKDMIEKKYIDMANEIKLLTSTILKQARRDLENRLAAQGIELSFLGFGVLHLLVAKELTIKDLSGRMMLAPATLVPVIDQLEAKKLIKRQIDKDDRRRTPLAITAAGKKILQVIGHNKQIDVVASKLQELGYEKSKNLFDSLYQLGAAVVGQEALDSVLKIKNLNK